MYAYIDRESQNKQKNLIALCTFIAIRVYFSIVLASFTLNNLNNESNTAMYCKFIEIYSAN